MPLLDEEQKNQNNENNEIEAPPRGSRINFLCFHNVNPRIIGLILIVVVIVVILLILFLITP